MLPSMIVEFGVALAAPPKVRARVLPVPNEPVKLALNVAGPVCGELVVPGWVKGDPDVVFIWPPKNPLLGTKAVLGLAPRPGPTPAGVVVAIAGWLKLY